MASGSSSRAGSTSIRWLRQRQAERLLPLNLLII
jgi:hypothetical protein